MITGAVLGFPISHSLSPVLHRAAYEYLGIQGSYTAVEVRSGQLANFLKEVAESGDRFDYLSLTMPLKEEVVTLGYERDPLVQRIQSANTLYQKSGNWIATSTDGSGFIQALSNFGMKEFNKTLILGAGGTARAVAGVMGDLSAHVHVMGRTSSRESVIRSCVEKAQFSYLPWDSEIDFAFYDLVVNTTPAGAADLLAESVPSGPIPVLFDVIYKPWPTVLAQRWLDQGGEVINGLELLIYQGIDQLDLVVDIGASREDLAEHLRRVLNRQ